MRAEGQLEGIVEDNLAISLLRFISVLRDTGSISFNDAPIRPRDKVIFCTNSIIFTDLPRLDVAAHKQMKAGIFMRPSIDIQIVAAYAISVLYLAR